MVTGPIPVERYLKVRTGLNSHSRRSYIRADSVHVSATRVSAHCQLNPAAFVKWADRIKDGTPRNWLQKHEMSRSWTEEERERVLEALSFLPDALLVNSVKGIYRLGRSGLYGSNPASGQPGEIAVYDGAFEPKQNLSRILGHEIAHELFRQLSGSEKLDYSKAADWLTVEKKPKE